MIGSGALSLLLCGCGPQEPLVPENIIVTVPGLGELHGYVPGEFHGDVTCFAGIPYAKPPLGALRWQPPQPFGAWNSPRDAAQFQEICYQLEAEGSEDCLYLNVAMPSRKWWQEPGSVPLRPVMLWIHGGAYQIGGSNRASATQPVYTVNTSAAALVKASDMNCVVVTFNYRLNVFGFLGSAELQQQTSDGSVGNFGIQDQRMAMAWVRDNIAAFGGDGSRITIFGDSAGGNSVINHLAQPDSAGMFSGGIIQSGAYDNGGTTMAKAEAGYASLLTAVGCEGGGVACLREKDASTLMNACVGQLFASCAPGPVIDSVKLADAPTAIIAAGNHNKVPVMIGSNRDEFMTPWFFGFPHDMNESMVEQAWAALGNDLSAIPPAKVIYNDSVYTYPAERGDYSVWAWMVGRMMTDKVPGLGYCAVRNLARVMASAGTPAVYAYSFDQTSEQATAIAGTGPGAVIVPHSGEIPYAFGDIGDIADGEEEDLALAMAKYWVAFGTTGKPNPQGLPSWPAYDQGEQMHFEAGSGGIRTKANVRQEACDFWDTRVPTSSVFKAAPPTKTFVTV